jgi:hypothetical protein
MANSFAVSRSHLIYGFCLPLAVVIGYLLGSPLENGSVGVIVLVLSVISVPLMMRWHHPLLIIAWNAMITPSFIPGRPVLWMVLAGLSLSFSALNRSVGQQLNFFQARSVAKALLFLGGVVMVTALLNGGIGMAGLGAATAGGKRYFYIFAAIVGYFALSTYKIPPHKARLYVALFFLSGLTALVGYLALTGGPFPFIVNTFFSQDTGMEEVADQDLFGPETITRLGDVSMAALAVACWLMARFGIRGLLDLKRPWRGVFFAGMLVASMFGGFRSVLILLCLTFSLLFYFEGLFRTRYFLILGLITTVVGLVVVANLNKMPLPIQRSLSFLPVNVDPLVRQNAEGSTKWRVEMWKELLPDVPKYLVKGKGYGINPSEFFMARESAARGYLTSAQTFILTGNYHSGPLSVIMPFGIFGAVGFLWFLGAAINVLMRNYRHGDPSLSRVNAFILAFFIAHAISFFFIFGSLYSDLFIFTGLAGLSVSLNGGVCGPSEELAETSQEWVESPAMRLRMD